jgi:hypothetical protein
VGSRGYRTCEKSHRYSRRRLKRISGAAAKTSALKALVAGALRALLSDLSAPGGGHAYICTKSRGSIRRVRTTAWSV